MSLILTITRVRGRSPPRPESRRFDKPRITLGRGSENDWVLEDRERHVSGKHCVIVCDSGRYTVTDWSTNGLFVDGERVTHKQPVAISTGTHLTLADIYEISVEVDDPSAREAGTGRGGTVGLPDFEDNPFAGYQPKRGTQQEPMEDLSRLLGSGDNPFDDGGQSAPSVRARVGQAESPFESMPYVLPTEPPADREEWPIAEKRQRTTPPPKRGSSYDHDSPELESFRPPGPKSRLPDDWPYGTEERAPSPQPAPTRPVVEAAAERPAVLSSNDALSAFLEGAGVKSAAVANAEPKELLRGVGQLFRKMTEGLQAILQSRRIVKSEYRIAQTQIQSSNNNPLKFSVTVEQAVAGLLQKREGYTSAPEAIEEAFRDIRDHEMALLEGMQSTLRSLMAEFHPDRLKKRLDEQPSIINVLPARRKARYWKIYEEEYERIANSALEDARGMFNQIFAEAYEDFVSRRR